MTFEFPVAECHRRRYLPQITCLGIDIWHGAGAPACSSKRSRSFPRAVGPHIEIGPKYARSTVPACPVRILVRESDHPGGTERAKKSGAGLPTRSHA
jgi:hypothetical protein